MYLRRHAARWAMRHRAAEVRLCNAPIDHRVQRAEVELHLRTGACGPHGARRRVWWLRSERMRWAQAHGWWRRRLVVAWGRLVVAWGRHLLAHRDRLQQVGVGHEALEQVGHREALFIDRRDVAVRVCASRGRGSAAAHRAEGGASQGRSQKVPFATQTDELREVDLVLEVGDAHRVRLGAPLRPRAALAVAHLDAAGGAGNDADSGVGGGARRAVRVRRGAASLA